LDFFKRRIAQASDIATAQGRPENYGAGLEHESDGLAGLILDRHTAIIRPPNADAGDGFAEDLIIAAIVDLFDGSDP